MKEKEELDNYYSSMVVEDRVSVIDAGKCIPMPFTQNGYKYENSLGSESWSIPQLTALYSLAKQKNDNLSYDEFVEICYQTASITTNGTKLLNSVGLIKEVEYRKENEIVLSLDN